VGNDLHRIEVAVSGQGGLHLQNTVALRIKDQPLRVRHQIHKECLVVSNAIINEDQFFNHVKPLKNGNYIFCEASRFFGVRTLLAVTLRCIGKMTLVNKFIILSAREEAV
jgi:hypothetical protein